MFYPRGERQERFVAVAAELADRFALDAADKVRTGAFPSANFDAIRGKSVPRMVVPAEPGGLGANLLETVMTVERLASVQRHLG